MSRAAATRARGVGWPAVRRAVRRLSAASLVVLAAACAPAAAPEPLRVFAAASLQGPLDDVAARWTARSGRRVAIAYAGTPVLARQIDRGAPADVFLAADRDWIDWLAGRGRLAAGPVPAFAGNSLVLVAPRAASFPAAAADPRDVLPAALGDTGRLAVADTATVPAGRVAAEALRSLGRWDAVAGRLAEGADVRAALAFVARGEAPLGIVYATDARSAPAVRVVAAFPADTHAPIVYSAARLAGADARDADAFIAYLRGPDAGRVFAAAGFATGERGP